MPAALPDHPTVPFREYISIIAEKYVSGFFQKKLFLFFSHAWYSVFNVAKHEERIKNCFANGENGYLLNYKRFSSVFCPEFSASFILNEKSEEAPARKASKLIVGILRFRERVLGNRLEPDYEGTRPLDMEGYRFFFSRLGISSLKNKTPLHEVVDVPPSNYIIIAIDGLHYKLQVIRDEKIIPISEIHEQVSRIIEEAKTRLAQVDFRRFPFGQLTTLLDKKSIALFNDLAENNHSAIEQINNAIFFVAIDIHDAPQSLEKLGRGIQWQNFHNRDYRRSMQVVVTGTGKAGIVIDPSAGIGGGYTGRLLDELVKESSQLETELTHAARGDEGKLYQAVNFNNDNLIKYQDRLISLTREIESRFYTNEYNTIFRLDGIGKKDFSQLSVSADAAFHAALHLTFKRCFGKIPNIGNFIGLRSVRHGGIFRYNSTTAELKNFISAPGAESLRAAVDAHKTLIKQIKQGRDEFYQCSMMLVTLFFRYEIGLIGCLSLLIILSLFIKNFTRRFMNQDMWVSHIPELPGVAVTGRPGVKLSFLQRPALAGHYMIFDHHIMICFVSNPGRPSYYGQEAKFAAALQEALLEVRNILARPGGQPAAAAPALG